MKKTYTQQGTTETGTSNSSFLVDAVTPAAEPILTETLADSFVSVTCHRLVRRRTAAREARRGGLTTAEMSGKSVAVKAA